MKDREVGNKYITFKVVSFISVALFLISVTAWGVSAYTKLDNQCQTQNEIIEESECIQKELLKKIQSNEMNYVEIKTKLINIEVMLLELKNDFKSI